MKTIAIFRPGCAFRRTVFENQLLCYDHLQKHHGYQVKIFVDEAFNEFDHRFEWINLPRSCFQQNRYIPSFVSHNKCVRVLREFLTGVNVLITPDPVVYPQSHLSIDAARQCNSRILIDSTITLLTETPFGRFNRFHKKRCQKSLDNCHNILAPTPKVIERYSHIGLLTKPLAEKFLILGHAVDTDRFLPSLESSPPQKDIVCISRLIPEKGISYILASFLSLARDHPLSRLVFIGEGPMEGYIQKTAPELYGKQVIVKKNLPHELLHTELRHVAGYISHPLATPKWEEYFGVANIEAMSCGLPVILSKSGALYWSARPPARVSWTEERNVEQIREAMKWVLSLTLEERQTIASTNRNYVVDNYSLHAITTQLVAFALGN